MVRMHYPDFQELATIILFTAPIKSVPHFHSSAGQSHAGAGSRHLERRNILPPLSMSCLPLH